MPSIGGSAVTGLGAHWDCLGKLNDPAYYHQALALAEELGMRPLVAHGHLGLGRLGRRAGQHELAERHWTMAGAMFREMGMSHWLEKAEAASAQ